MINEMRDFVLELVQSEYETGHILAEDRAEFNELCRDEGYRATKAMYDLYEDCHNLGPAGFYAAYKDELDFDPMFVSEYGKEEDEESYLTGEDLRAAIDEEMPFIRENIGENGTLEDAVNDFMLACEESSMSADRSEVEAILADYFDSELDDTMIEEALSNREKLKRAYPELNFDNPVNESINEDIDDNKVKKAVGVLYAMDNFVLSVMDNMYWLSMGVPDGEFDEVDRHAAEVNFADHDWLIVDDDKFDTDAFKDLIDAFEEATDDADDYNQTERKALIDEAKKILSTNESVEDMDRRCEICNTLLNDMGECPKCDHGEEDIDEALNEDTLNEGPFDKLKKYINSKKDVQAAAERGAAKTKEKTNRTISNLGKILAADYSDDSRMFLVDDKWIDAKTFQKQFPASKIAAQSKDPKLSETSIENYPELAQVLNTVVRDKDGWIVRRGLEVLKPKEVPYNPEAPYSLKIKDGYKAEDIIGKYADKTQSAQQPAEETEGTTSETQDETNTSEKPTEEIKETPKDEKPSETSINNESPAAEVKTPDWINDKSIKAAVNLLSKRQNSEGFFDAEGNLIDYKNIDVDNYDSIYLDKKQERSFADALKQIKDNYAKRKAAVAKNAAIFGESLDDDMSYDSVYSDYPLDEGVSYDDMQDILGLAKELGIHNGKDLITFIERERIDDEPVRDILKRYRDNLGDDFEIIEEATECDSVNEEYTDAKEIKSLVLNNEKRDHIDSIINRAANYFHINPEDLIIFEDKDFELDPGYFADDAKELNRDLIRFTVATIDVLRAKINHASLLFFKNKEEADTYIEAAKAGNI